MTEPLAHVTWKPLRDRCGFITQATEAELRKPQRWNKSGGRRVLIQQDLFGDFRDSLRAPIFRTIDVCQNVTWLVVTDDPARARSLWPVVCNDQDMGGNGVTMSVHRPNVALLVRCRSQLGIARNLPSLFDLRSYVPVLGLFLDGPRGEISLRGQLGKLRCIDWIVLRGGRRPLHPEVVRSVRDQCQDAATPFWFDTWGTWRPQLPQIAGEPAPLATGQWGTLDRRGAWYPKTTPWNGNQDRDSENCEVVMIQTGHERSGRMIDGQEWTQLPRGMK